MLDVASCVEGQFTLHNFCLTPGFLRVVKIEWRFFSTPEIQLKIGRVIIYREYVWFKCGLQVKTIIIWPMRKIVTLPLWPLQPYMETWLKTVASNVLTTWVVLCNWRCIWLHGQIKTYQMPLSSWGLEIFLGLSAQYLRQWRTLGGGGRPPLVSNKIKGSN